MPRLLRPQDKVLVWCVGQPKISLRNVASRPVIGACATLGSTSPDRRLWGRIKVPGAGRGSSADLNVVSDGLLWGLDLDPGSGLQPMLTRQGSLLEGDRPLGPFFHPECSEFVERGVQQHTGSGNLA